MVKFKDCPLCKIDNTDLVSELQKDSVVLIKYQQPDKGWENTSSNQFTKILKIVYLGNCSLDGHMFAVYMNNIDNSDDPVILICQGEFIKD